jgi:ERCC4-type nuclease
MDFKDMDDLLLYDSCKGKEMIHITADDREQKSEVIKSLFKIENVAIDIRRLSIGDYQIGKRVIIERKTLKDLVISIVDGRLFRQMIRLANSTYQGVLILEGTATGAADIRITRASVQGALINVSLILGIPVLRSKDPSETARLIVYIGRQLNSITRRGMQRHGDCPKGNRKRQLYILQGLPGIGPERAGRLLDRFGSVETVITASSTELQSVEGIGKRIADRIRWVVSEVASPCNTYLSG